MVAENRLNNLAEVRRRGRSVELEEELPAAAYATLYTGLSLADHGVHFPLQWSAAHQVSRPYDHLLLARLERHSLFSRLAAHGLRVLVLDPPECAAHEVFGGVLASGVQFRARVLLREWSRPEAAGRTLLASLGRAPRVEEVFGRPTRKYLLSMRRQLLAAPARLAKAVERLIDRGSFDLVWVNFAAAHQAGHVLFDPSLAQGLTSADEERTLRSALEDVYVKVDEALGRILERLPPRSDLLLLSPKGMGANTARVDLLSGMLDRVLSQGGDRVPRPGNPLWWLRSCAPISVRSWVASALPDRMACALAGRLETLGRDWTRTRAFAPPCDNHGFVRFNLKGRERRGSVPVEDSVSLGQEIVDGLASFEDMGGDTPGAPSVARVETLAERVGPGARTDHLPDLFVHWSSGSSVRVQGARSSRFGEVRRQGVGTGRTGNHCRGAWLTMVPGRTQVIPTLPQSARLEDVPATICSALGVPHDDLPGRPFLTRT